MSARECKFQRTVELPELKDALHNGVCDHCGATVSELIPLGQVLEICGQEYCFDYETGEPDWLAMMQVILLSRIDRYDPKKSKEIADAVLSGELSQADTKSILDEARLAEKPAVVIARGGFGGQRRARDFEVSAKMLFKQNTNDIFNVENLTVREGRTFEPLATDLIVYEGSEPFAAIEIKGPRNRIDPGYLIDQLARAALLLRKVPQVLYVVPEQSEYKLSELVAIRDKLEIEGIKFGTLPEKSRLAPKDLKVLG